MEEVGCPWRRVQVSKNRRCQDGIEYFEKGGSCTARSPGKSHVFVRYEESGGSSTPGDMNLLTKRDQGRWVCCGQPSQVKVIMSLRRLRFMFDVGHVLRHRLQVNEICSCIALEDHDLLQGPNVDRV